MSSTDSPYRHSKDVSLAHGVWLTNTFPFNVAPLMLAYWLAAGLLSTIAPWKYGQLPDDTRWNPIELAPALSPNSVTRLGSPPKFPMLSCTQAIARR
jgi:hypothetical protein